MKNAVAPRDRWTSTKGDIQLIRQSEFHVLRYLQKHQRVLFSALCDKLHPDGSDRYIRNGRMTLTLQRLVPLGLLGVELVGNKEHAFAKTARFAALKGIFTGTVLYLKSPEKTEAIFQLLKAIDWFGIRVDENDAPKCLLAIHEKANDLGLSKVCSMPSTRTLLYKLYREIQGEPMEEVSLYRQKLTRYIEFVNQRNTETGKNELYCFLNPDGLRVVMTWIQVTKVIDAIAAEHAPA